MGERKFYVAVATQAKKRDSCCNTYVQHSLVLKYHWFPQRRKAISQFYRWLLLPIPMMLKVQTKTKSSQAQVGFQKRRFWGFQKRNQCASGQCTLSWVYYTYFKHLALGPTSSPWKILGNPTTLFILGCSMILFSPSGWTSACQTLSPLSKMQPN